MQRGETTPITPAETDALLPGFGTALLEFVVAEDKSYLIVLTKDRTKSTPQITLYPLNVKSKQLSEAVNNFRRMLADRDLSYQATARQLYDLLLKPAEEQLRGRKILCVVPDKALWELPFQALQSRPGVHMIEDFTIFYAPSLTVLREMMKKRLSSTPAQFQVVKASHPNVPPSSSSRAARTLFALGNPQLSNETAVGSEEASLVHCPRLRKRSRLSLDSMAPPTAAYSSGHKRAKGKLSSRRRSTRCFTLQRMACSTIAIQCFRTWLLHR